jgi:hypothetical protein
MEHMVKFSIIVNFDKGISKEVPKQAQRIFSFFINFL